MDAEWWSDVLRGRATAIRWAIDSGESNLLAEIARGVEALLNERADMLGEHGRTEEGSAP